MLKSLNKLKEGILDVLLPRFCVSCGKEGRYICDHCEVFLSEAINNVDKLVSIWEYEGLVEKLIYKIKFNGQTHIINELVEKAFKVMAKDAARFRPFLSFLLGPDTYITFVPMYKKKEKERGFNQAALLAQKLGLVLHPVEHKPRKVLALLKKAKDNRSQVGLSPKEREENVKGVFEFQGLFSPQQAVLVDDVYTTGATVRECVRVLRKAGVKKIWIFTLTRKFNL